MTAVACLQDWARSFTAGQPPGTVCLDLSDLRFVDVAGLRALAAAYVLLQRRCASVELTGRPESLDRIADLTGTDLFSRPARPAVTAAGDGAAGGTQPGGPPPKAAGPGAGQATA